VTGGRTGLPRTLGAVARSLMPGATSRARHVTGRNARSVRHHYAPVVTGLVEPFVYLLSVGVGIGALVGRVEVDGRSWDYTTFVAPAMLAASAMNGAISEATFNIFAKLRWEKLYDAMIATPLSPSDIAVGELLFAQLRGTFYSAAFLATMAALGLVESWWALLALPATMLVGSAFASAGLTGVSWFRSWEDADAVFLVQMVLFLFSATFYPLSVYPAALRWLAQASPLYHGVALCRDLVLGTTGWHDLGHAAFLALMTAVFLRIAAHRFTMLLYQQTAGDHTPR
jgi:lipooligosaccharide transport system permease protein